MKSVENMFEKYGRKLLSTGRGFEKYLNNFRHLVLENIGQVGIVQEIAHI